MYYELYVDSLFLVNFVMNLYLLLLVNRSLFRTATRKHLILGAAIGSLLYLLSLCCGGTIGFGSLFGIPLSGIVMIVVTFRVRSIRTFFTILEKLLMYSVLMGGTMLLIIKKLPWLERRIAGIWGILGMGALLYLLFGYLMERKMQKDSLCKVTLCCKGSKITVTALVDSGNSLVEPISGKPVSIIEKDMILSLWREEPCLFRAVPYHSIGKKRGILKAYLLPEIQIEVDGATKICKEIYVAICEEYITSAENKGKNHVKMILNPSLLTESIKVHERGKTMKKERYGYYYDIESGSSG